MNNNNNNNNNTLNLTDADVNKLISLTKEVLKEYDIKLTDRAKGDVKITSINSDEYFILNYFIRPGSAILNFRETRYNLCLIRLNLNDNFHKIQIILEYTEIESIFIPNTNLILKPIIALIW